MARIDLVQELTLQYSLIIIIMSLFIYLIFIYFILNRTAETNYTI